MNKQIRYGFKKEWLQFSRTFRFGGIIIAIISFAIADPLMYKMLAVMMAAMPELMNESLSFIPALVSTAGEFSAGEMFEEVAGMYNDAGMVFSLTMVDLCVSAVLISMLILMSPSGGEQKKRATIIPAASGLDYFNYLVPKFVLYPATIFVLTFLSAVLAGFLCNGLFTENNYEVGLMFLGALLCAIYAAFIIAVYMGIGLCTSRPGVATIIMYFGTTLIQLILTSLDLTQYHPFTLRALVSGEMFAGDFVLSDNIASIAVGAVLSVVIGVVMFFMTLCVLKAKRINNQEDKPEF